MQPEQLEREGWSARQTFANEQAGAAKRQDFNLDVLDLREQNLPFFNEPAAPVYTEGHYSEPAAEAWRRKIGEYDAFRDIGWLNRSEQDLTHLRLAAEAAGARVILYAGEPQNEPIVQRDPFVGGSRSEISAYYGAYRAGSFPRLGEIAGRPAARADQAVYSIASTGNGRRSPAFRCWVQNALPRPGHIAKPVPSFTSRARIGRATVSSRSSMCRPGGTHRGETTRNPSLRPSSRHFA